MSIAGWGVYFMDWIWRLLHHNFGLKEVHDETARGLF